MPTKTDKLLRGTWKSDRRRTIAEWLFSNPLTPEQRRKFLSIFGKLKVTYTPTRIHVVFGAVRSMSRYEVLATDSDSVAIRYEDTEIWGEWRILHIHFEGPDRFWINVYGQNREWFRRVRVKTADTL